MQRWRTAVAPDLHQTYGMSDADPGFWGQPFWLIRDRVNGLLDLPDTRLFHIIAEAVRTQHEHDMGAMGAP